MNDIKITKTGLSLREMIPTSVVLTFEAIMRGQNVTVTEAVGIAYARGVESPEKYPECAKAVKWLRDTTYTGGPDKTWLIIHERMGR